MASYGVFVTEEAETDLDEIVEYVEFHDSTERADYLYEKIKQAILKLEVLPGRGRVVPELREMGITEFREILYKPYRILPESSLKAEMCRHLSGFQTARPRCCAPRVASRIPGRSIHSFGMPAVVRIYQRI